MHFVIAGIINCPQFSYAVMVAQRLKENLPDFTYLKIPKKPEEWERWLIKTCRENQWYHIHSPLIWREIGLKQGKKDFVGDINKFLDLCYDYYGIPQEVLSAGHFNRGEMNWFTNRTESEFFESIKLETQKRREYRSRQVCITGASCQISEIIVMELLHIDLQKREDGLEIRLFDDPTKEKKLTGAANDGKHCPGPSGFGNCRVVTTLKEALTNIDLVIVLDSFPRKPKESVVKWLKRNRNAMCALGKALDLYAPIHCRVIIGSPSPQPVCYNATVLACYAKKLHVRNIVAVTQDLGREMLSFLSKKTNTPLKDFYCPPVWGFVGLNKYIDLRRTLQTHLYKVPGKRVNSTLPQGEEEYELRTCECLISEDDCKELHIKVSNHKADSYPQLGRWPGLAKATAILDLLKVWGLKQEDGNGEILCLGVYSDGTFNIPQGIYWSQPVILKDGFWVPFADFPIPRDPNFDCYYLFLYSIAALYRTKVKPRIYISPKKVPKPKENKKFNFSKISEEVGMPVIRTDTECVAYLKNLAKLELGIDLDEVINYIEEEEEDEECEITPMEEIVKEQIFCECWRQELKELQKIVFDRSSTTEVEVGLSDNTSGSEWSVINIPNLAKEDLPPPSAQDSAVHEKNKSNTSSSSTTVCTCERLSTDSPCQCLVIPEVKEEAFKEEQSSTQHFYKVQNVEIYDEDLKDAIYEDTYTGEKHVSFDLNAKQDDESGFHLKFYGKKDAIRDKERDLKMQKRISNYDRDGEDSIVDEDKSVSEKREPSLTASKQTDEDRIPGEGYGFYEDEDGGSNQLSFPGKLAVRNNENLNLELEHSKRIQKIDLEKESSTSVKVMPSDAVVPAVHIDLSDTEKSFKSLEKDWFMLGEENRSYSENYGEVLENLGEENTEQFLAEPYEEGGEVIFGGEELFDDNYVQEKEPLIIPKRKREGIPFCCLCRCLVPEGLPCCPCGTTKVVEVFKKESEEIFIQSEDDISYRVEYFETERRESSIESLLLEDEEDLSKFELPPESFLPFFPKAKNKFMESIRPLKLTKEYVDSLKKTELKIPPKCSELLNRAKVDLEEQNTIEKESVAEEKENLPTACEEMEQIKTDFSDLKLFIPCGLEDWRLTVQKKYREWFFQGAKIKDEAYYDIAIEEVSEDDFEVDEEIEQYFEN